MVGQGGAEAEGLLQTPGEAYLGAIAGRLSDLVGHSLLDGEAWGVAIAAQRWALEGQGGPPCMEELRALSAEGGERLFAAAYAATQSAKALLVGFDWSAAERWLSLHGQLAEETRHPAITLVQRLLCLWQQVLREGGTPELLEEAKALARHASRARASETVIEATAAQSLIAYDLGDMAEALAAARRASRMAATEGRRWQLVLANVVLARMRRLSGKPHLAARILTGLGHVAPPAWQGWLAVELVLASGDAAGPSEQHGSESCTHAALLGAGLGRAVQSARSGFRADFDAAKQVLRSGPKLGPSLGRDIADTIALLDADEPDVHASLEVVEWRNGSRDELPSWVSGLCAPAGLQGEEEGAVGWVLAGGHGSPCRVLRAGVPLLCGGEQSVAEKLPQSQRRSGRTDTCLAVLALSSDDGLPVSELFSRAYGFVYRPELHQEVLRMMLSRARGRIEGRGKVVHRQGTALIRLKSATVLPDPRCAPPIDGRVLAWLALHGRGSAKDVAQQLGISLRSAQEALKQLREDGACSMQRKGRFVEYRVTDTTFSDSHRP